jgi:hypothetical protein
MMDTNFDITTKNVLTSDHPIVTTEKLNSDQMVVSHFGGFKVLILMTNLV